MRRYLFIRKLFFLFFSLSCISFIACSNDDDIEYNADNLMIGVWRTEKPIPIDLSVSKYYYEYWIFYDNGVGENLYLYLNKNRKKIYYYSFSFKYTLDENHLEVLFDDGIDTRIEYYDVDCSKSDFLLTSENELVNEQFIRRTQKEVDIIKSELSDPYHGTFPWYFRN